MADISRDTFQETNNYDELIFQQDLPLINSELNELQDIRRHKDGLQFRAGVGNFPQGSSFKIVPSTIIGNVVVQPGVFINDGKVLELHDPVEVSSLSSNPVATVLNDVYAIWTESEVDSIEDPDIKLEEFGVETARRLRQDISILTLEAGNELFVGESQQAVYLGQVNRPTGVSAVGERDITDLRVRYNQNYVVDQIGYTSLALLGPSGSFYGARLTVAGGTIIVADQEVVTPNEFVDFALTEGQVPFPVLEEGEIEIYYIWYDINGTLRSSSTIPAPPSVIIFRVERRFNGFFIEDVQTYAPASVERVNNFIKDIDTNLRKPFFNEDISAISNATAVETEILSEELFVQPRVGVNLRTLEVVFRARAINTPGIILVRKTQHNPAASPNIASIAIDESDTYEVYSTSIDLASSSAADFGFQELFDLALIGVNLETAVPPLTQVLVDMYEVYGTTSAGSRKIFLHNSDFVEAASVAGQAQTTLKNIFITHDPRIGVNIEDVIFYIEARGVDADAVGRIRVYYEDLAGGNNTKPVTDGSELAQFDIPMSGSLQLFRISLAEEQPTQLNSLLKTVQGNMRFSFTIERDTIDTDVEIGQFFGFVDLVPSGVV